jgi:pimeloyl-ACP methyl ester carboxylesterase
MAVGHPTTSAPRAGQNYSWKWKGQILLAAYEIRGEGKPVLLLPALSTVSSRSEMEGLATQLLSQYQVTTLDWIGFGDSDRPALDYCPVLYHQFLQDFVRDRFSEPVAVIAAGHAAGYVMQLAQQHPSVWSKVILVAPTWRGPLPMMGASSQVASLVRQIVRSPLLGQFLYKLNTLPSFLNFMYRRHVYVDAAKLTPEFIKQKYQITQQPGARFAPAAFVTGALDPVYDRANFLAWFRTLSIPVMVLIGEQSPSKSKSEMEALIGLPGVQVQKLPGTLGMHEEYAAEVTRAVLPFLL